ncbi:hypothetical protein EK21DRAFT_51356 [Setomelanomma holmii]|uniref:GPI mannosyltransferase 2 n=1 Tax=Setomelanomma holmii TaxID=210430 RepID=A0A9P4HLX1_9PLEO|nr:hypothetical protein EK21DRAFT_51356 [Setomelanomma holmii]
MTISETAVKGQKRQLILIFCLWKALLFSLAVFCPGPGYDTSALMLVDSSTKRHKNFLSLSRTDRVTMNLLRWDALYFAKAAERGKVHEQEWAFSWVYPWLIGNATRCKCAHVSDLFGDDVPDTRQYAMVGIGTSTVCHLLSVLVLYRLLTVTADSQQQRLVPFVGAVLHILTPASLFLSAPYAEALFSLLNFTGMLLYAQARALAATQPPSFREDILKLGSGVLFGLAALMRSNGLLSGLIILYDLARYLPHTISKQLTVHDVRRTTSTIVAGCFVLLGFVWPQYLAYGEFCTRSTELEFPPWCNRTIPSIYSWVQSRYCIQVLRNSFQPRLHGRSVPHSGTTVVPGISQSVTNHVPELALPQLVLALAAITSFHVQIVNRIASGYPTWYLMVATWLTNEQPTSSISKSRSRSQWVIRGMIMYGLVQGILFSNFLPPA